MSRARMRSTARRGGALACVAAVTLAGASCSVGGQPVARVTPSADASLWPLLVHASEDLGPARERQIPLTVDLAQGRRPAGLQKWAAARGLLVEWRDRQPWAVLTGAPERFEAAFGLSVHDFRSPSGLSFYGAVSQPTVPAALGGEVTAVGRLGEIPLGRDTDYVPHGGLNPTGILQAYDALTLARAGYTGAGQTIVLFEWTDLDQADVDLFTKSHGLPPVAVARMGDFAQAPAGAGKLETVMDVEDVHAVAPGATIVLADATPYTHLADVAGFFADVDRRYPGAIWSFSISWTCDRATTWPDLQPIDAALAAAERHGTSAFAAAGDTGGLECKRVLDKYWDSPPSQADVGLNAFAALPSMTSVGGTTLSVSRRGEWFVETAWAAPASSQGTGGGVSTIVPRPDYQRGVGAGLPADAAGRIVPDVALVGDPVSGVSLGYGGELTEGAGTSTSAPLWAGLTAVMNSYLEANGGHRIGALNPLVYAMQAGRPPYVGFHDITAGGNVVWYATPGHDPVTGWGTPDTWNLVRDVLAVQKAGGR